MIATQSVPVDKTARGQAITRRRVTLGIKSVNEFAAITQVSRGAITAAEDGRGSENTYVRLETWLDRREDEAGFEPGEVLRDAERKERAEAAKDEPPQLDTVEFRIAGNFGVDVIVKGPVADMDKLESAVTRLVRELREKD